MLLAKGADNVIFDRLRAGNDEMKDETERHLSEFANTGLRTLTLAYKIIPGESPVLSTFRTAQLIARGRGGIRELERTLLPSHRRNG